MPGSFIAVHYPGSIRKGDDRISQEEYFEISAGAVSESDLLHLSEIRRKPF